MNKSDITIKLLSSYSQKIDIIGDVPFDFIKDKIYYIIDDILTYDILTENINIGISNDKTAYIRIKNNNQEITIDLFFEELDFWESWALLNIVKDKVNICSYSNTVPLVLAKLHKFLI